MILRSASQEPGASVDLTPVIDMVFLLLIFFLVATTFHQTEREMNIALPEASSAEPMSTLLREFVINVAADGSIIVSGQPTEPAALKELVAQAVRANSEQKVTVRADRTASYAAVVAVLDVCKGAGIQQPYLDTVPLHD